jgi:hypothetical protein
MPSQTHQLAGLGALPMLASSPWQMSYGERAAMEGVLAQIRPSLALEIGTAEGGSLRRIAAYSQEVHSFDLVPPDAEVSDLPNVTFHTGDSHALLPQALADLAAAGRLVDFVLIDGDHTADGVQQDLEHILSSPALERAIVLLHDTMNQDVRRGIERVNIAEHPKVALVDLDLVPGSLSRREPYRLQMWGGLGMFVVDAGRTFNRGGAIRDDRFHELFAVVSPVAQVMIELEAQGTPLDGMDGRSLDACLQREIVNVHNHLARRDQLIRDMKASLSWRITTPLREAKRHVNGFRKSWPHIRPRQT